MQGDNLLLQLSEAADEKLTRNQQLVLKVLRQSDQPLGAYHILEHLREEGLKAPLQVYRALERLIEIGRVHRLESRNAFVICKHSCDGHLHPHFTIFHICEDCGQVTEYHDEKVERSMLRHAKETGFTVRNSTIEVRGICPDCNALCRSIKV